MTNQTKHILNHPAISSAGLASVLYPNVSRPRQILYAKVKEVGSARITEADESKILDAAISILTDDPETAKTLRGFLNEESS